MSFRFTSTADIKDGDGSYLEFPVTLQGIKSNLGDEGEFHLTLGDLDDAPTNRLAIDSELGASSIWVPLVGNHEVNGLCGGPPGCVPWMRTEFSSGNGGRNSLESLLNATPGPTGTSETTFYWDKERIRFIFLNEYWDGTTGANADASTTSGEIIQEMLDWLEPVLADAQSKNLGVLVMGHEPAFNDNRKSGDCLDRTISTRDAFWEMLEDYDVMAYLCGDSHHYGAYKVGPNTVTGFGGEPITSGGAWDATQTQWDRKNNVWQIDLGFGAVYGSASFEDDHETFVNFAVLDNEVAIEVFQNSATGQSDFAVTETISIPIPFADEYNEYTVESGGGFWYYKQDKPGTEWFDHADNSKGWTVDFNLKVSDINDSIENLIEDAIDGAGVYVNDGVAQESITFLTQEILFQNANKKIVYDTTGETNYRLIGVDDGLKLFARSSQHPQRSFSLIAEVSFQSVSTKEANGARPSVTEDLDGNFHSVWIDDGNSSGQIFYSKFSNREWSAPELISDEGYGTLSPNIIVDNEGIIYVAYEYQDRGDSSIALIYKNDLGWSNPYLMGTETGAARKPDMTFDSQYNVIIVWQDSRFANPEIYLNKFTKETLSIGTDIRLTNNTYIVTNPSVSSYFDDIFITCTKKETDTTSAIEIVKYNSSTGLLSEGVALESVGGFSDFPDVLINSSSEVIVVWSDTVDGRKNIYSSVLNLDLQIIISSYEVTDTNQTNGGSSFPALAEQYATGDVYIVWQDYLENFSQFLDADEYDPYNAVTSEIRLPSDSGIFYATYKDKAFHSSGSGETDTQIDLQGNAYAFRPAVPSLFTGELPVLYEVYSIDESGFLYTDQMFKNINSYHLFEEYNAFGPFAISGKKRRKEIRFGDYSRNLNVHYVFKNFKYYLEDAVLPYFLTEVSASDYSILETLNANDVSVNNYGDVWMVGTCGMYYYISTGGLVLAGPGGDIDTTTDPGNGVTGHVKSIGFDKNNTLHVAAPDGIYASKEHIRCYTQEVVMSDINVLSFDRDNYLFFGVGSTLHKYTVNPYVSVKTFSFAGAITAIEVDDNNIVWVGTTSGLYRIKGDAEPIRYTTANGLMSNRINDIAIRNTAIRYIATPVGIAKMIGSSFNRDIRTNDEAIWNNNVKSVMWQDPNILWAGTISKINQILINDIEDTYETFVVEPVPSETIREDDLQQYYILLEDEQTIDANDILEVYINGTLIHHGYSLGADRIGLGDTASNEPVLLFETPLQHDDAVEIIIRRDLRLRASFEQTAQEKVLIGERLVRIKDLDVGEFIYIITEGNENEVKVNDSNTELPFDRVHLDTTPPTGTIKIPDNAQVDQTKIQVNITGTDTDLVTGVAGSGLHQMIVSNFENFTTNGFTPQTPVPFATKYEHDLGSSVQDVVFTPIGEGRGTSVRSQSVSGTDELFFTTSNPGRVYKYDSFNEVWDLLFSYDDDSYVDFIVNYSTKLIVSVGHDTEVAKLFIYEYQFDETGTFTGYSNGFSITVSESRIHTYQILNGLFYIGTGKGHGDEYNEGAGPNGGKIYYYNESVLQEVVRDIDDDVFDFTTTPGSSNIIAVTGESGFVYEVDILSGAAFPVHNDVEPLVSTSFIQQGDDGLVFIGGRDNGTLRRSKVDSNSFDISFQTIPGKVSALKVFPILGDTETVDTLYASVGNVLYYLSVSGAWTWKYTHPSNINDITFNENTGFIHLAVDNGVVKLSPAVQNKNIFLQLIDRAGNQTVLGAVATEAEIDSNPLADSIAIADLVDFINENKIFELDELGNTVFTLRGNNSFFSADRVEQEKGVYTSEIFDGTNDLVKWESISWQATEMANTEVKMYVRTSDSKNDILLVDWVGPYNNTQASGVDISHFSGQFIQFKIELLSNVKDVSPTFHKAIIQAITSEAIHFFTTNFAMTGRVHKGILTSQKLVPVSADVVFGINTTNSIDWNDYQVVDENRIFNVNQIGENVRIGIKLLSPSRTLTEADAFDEYGPYSSNLYVNTIDFAFLNDTGSSQNYHFKITLYEDVNLENEVYSAYSFEDQEGFNVNGAKIDADGVAISSDSTVTVLFTVPGSANIKCNTYYFVKIEDIYDFDAEGNGTFETVSDDSSYIASCSASFVDVVDFNFTNNEGVVGVFDFRIRFYNNPERTNIYKTVFSQNDTTGWFVDDVAISETGVIMSPGETVNVVYRPNLEDFETGTNYYLSIDAWENNQAEYVFSNSSYTFQARDATSLIYCGGYVDVPVVKNFGIMLELEDNQFVTLNL